MSRAHNAATLLAQFEIPGAVVEELRFRPEMNSDGTTLLTGMRNNGTEFRADMVSPLDRNQLLGSFVTNIIDADGMPNPTERPAVATIEPVRGLRRALRALRGRREETYILRITDGPAEPQYDMAA